jgi:glycosyltransferase involved in cell wall biosynthesis
MKEKVKSIAKKILRKGSLPYRLARRYYGYLSKAKWKVVNAYKLYKEKKHFDEVAHESLNVIAEYNNSDYIVFYNPTWLGVAASTKGLFSNYVPLEHVYKRKSINLIAKAIAENNIKSVIFSQLCDGWIQIIKKIKKYNKDVVIKVIWHGNCYEFFSDFTWGLNKEIMDLYNEGLVDAFGFVRSTMYEFYTKVGFKSYYLQNNVIKDNKGKTANNKNKKVTIGIYNADSRELKNIYTSLSAIRMVDNSKADIVPINDGATQFAKMIGLDFDSINDYIPNEELLKRIQKNDINIYPTYTENSPMFPLESFEMGVPCLLGNNNDYFVDTELGSYIILEKEDDPIYIRDRIKYVLENREYVMKLYREWKKSFDKKCQSLVDEFIK